MLSSSLIRQPVWHGLNPGLPEPVPLAPDRERQLLKQLQLNGRLVGLRMGQSELNHFRLDPPDSLPLFIKLVRGDHRESIERAETIARWLKNRKLHVAAPIKGFPRALDDGRIAVAMPFVDGRRLATSLEDMSALGELVAELHKQLASHPARAEWENATADRLACLSQVRADLASGRLICGPEPRQLCNLAADDRLDFARKDLLAQPLHGDLNPGNALFDPVARRVLLLDFEDVFHSVLPPIFELALIVERFVLVVARDDASAERCAHALLVSYDRTIDREVHGSDQVGCVLRSLSLRSLCTLALGERDGVQIGVDEWYKFFALEGQARQRASVIERIFSGQSF